MKILYAKDEPVLAKIVTEGLEKSGYEVLLAQNGQEAFDLFQTMKPDICILDIMMPVRQWTLEQWNAQLGRTTGIGEEVKELNSYLDLISIKVYRAKTKLLESNKPLTADNIKDLLTGNDEKSILL